MIDLALKYLATRLDQALQPRFGAGQPIVELAAPTQRGATALQADEGLRMTLVNLEREGTAGNTSTRTRPTAQGFAQVAQPLNLNLVVMLSAHYPNAYPKSLAVLSAAIAHFQAHPLVTPELDPTLPQDLARLSLEWRDMDLAGMHNLWSALGSDYLPSALFLVRMIVISGPGDGAPVAPITEIGLDDA